jgi:hypothetical protein
MKFQVLWDMMSRHVPCASKERSAFIFSFSLILWSLKMIPLGISHPSTHFQIPERCNRDRHGCENLKLAASAIFSRVRIVAKGDYYLCHVRPYVCLYGATRLPLDGFWWNLIFLRFFRKSVDKIQVSLKSHKNNGYLTWKRFHIYDSTLLNSS